MEMVAQIFGMTFMGIILICLMGTIGSYIAETYAPNNKIEKNIKEFEKKYKTK